MELTHRRLRPHTNRQGLVAAAPRGRGNPYAHGGKNRHQDDKKKFQVPLSQHFPQPPIQCARYGALEVAYQRYGASFGHAATRFPNARFPAQSVARALVLPRVRGQVERQWVQALSSPSEGQVQRTFCGHARHSINWNGAELVGLFVVANRQKIGNGLLLLELPAAAGRLVGWGPTAASRGAAAIAKLRRGRSDNCARGVPHQMQCPGCRVEANRFSPRDVY